MFDSNLNEGKDAVISVSTVRPYTFYKLEGGDEGKNNSLHD